MAAEQDLLALPQRPPRQRGRASKRARLDDGEKQAAAGASPTPAAAAAAQDGPPPAAAAQQAAAEEQRELQQQDAQVAHERGGDGDTGGDEPGDGDTSPVAVRLDLPAYRSAAVRGHKFEYLDHTADVQLHAWGATLPEAFENVGLCMFNYMTPLKGIDVDPSMLRQYEADGHDLQSLLFNFLDELLFGFATDAFVAKQLRITTFDRDSWRIVAEGRGERFDRQRHVCGTEVKAITYSAMQIREADGDAEVFVIVDI